MDEIKPQEKNFSSRWYTSKRPNQIYQVIPVKITNTSIFIPKAKVGLLEKEKGAVQESAREDPENEERLVVLESTPYTSETR